MTIHKKVVITEMDDRCTVGIVKPECDPQLDTLEGGFEQALAQVPEFLQDAEARWTENPRNPTTTVVTTPPTPARPTASTSTATTKKTAAQSGTRPMF